MADRQYPHPLSEKMCIRDRDKSGIQKGDSLVAVNGERLNSWNALVEKLDNMQADA